MSPDCIKVPFVVDRLRELETVEYPGFTDATSIQEALDTLHMKDNAGSRCLAYRPVALASQRINVMSNVQTRSMLALKVKRDASGRITEARVEGLIRRQHVFRELFDFTAECKDEQTLSQCLEASLATFKEKDTQRMLALLTQDTPVDLASTAIPPYKFSHCNLPFTARTMKPSTKVLQSITHNRIGRFWGVFFGDAELPTGPSEKCLKKAKSVLPEHIETVRQIFDERPIVSNAYLRAKISDPAIMANLKLILPMVAYHWQNGPWHQQWTKYGIDPRKDATCGLYQSIDLRNKMFARQLWRGKSTTGRSTELPSSLIPPDNPVHVFDGQHLALSHLVYQYCDLTHPPLMEIVNHPGNLRRKCTEREGWYAEGTAKRLRDIMKARWLELFRTTDLSALSSQKLEEILELVAPDSGNVGPLFVAEDGASQTLMDSMSERVSTDMPDAGDDDDGDDDDEMSDYEIFDY